MKLRDKKTNNPRTLKSTLKELENDSYRKFNVAFCLMSLLPFLVFFYILIVEIADLNILSGNLGFVLTLTLFVAVTGFYSGYLAIRRVLSKVVFYAIKAKHSDRLKSAFVASVSHELKNPLSIIKMNLFNISKGITGNLNKQQKRIIELCRRVVERMNCLVSNLLDLHRMESGIISHKLDLIDFKKIIKEQIKEFSIGIEKKGIRLVTRIPRKNLELWLYGDVVAQVVNNILGNAVKYTPSGGKIILSVTEDQEAVRLECTDNGPGVPDDKKEKIFNKFERASVSEEGTGLGLAIAKDIVEIHKGKIWVENAPGGGSNFIVIFPRDLR